MAEEKKEEKTVPVRSETRSFKYSNEVVFEFDIDVSEPELAIAEITDFISLMEMGIKDLTELRATFAKKIEKPEQKKKEEPKKEEIKK